MTMDVSRPPGTLRVLVMGAGGGIGYACAGAFAARGAELLLGDYSQERLKRAVGDHGGTARFCDVTSKASVAILAAEVIESGAVPDILVNAAGNGYVRTLGMVWLAHELLPAMRRAGDARLIVNLAPTRVDELPNGQFPYATTPMAFHGLSEALAVQAKGSATRVMTVLGPDARRIGIAEESHAILLDSHDAGRIAAESVRLLESERRNARPAAPAPDPSGEASAARRGSG